MCTTVMNAAATPGRYWAGLSVRSRRWLRIVALVSVLSSLAITGFATGFVQSLTIDSIRETMAEAGGWGVVLFFAVFAVGQLVQVPGFIFMAAAALVWGQLAGGLIAYAGAVLSVVVTFWLVRAVGGQLLTEVDKPLMKRVLARLDRSPVRTVALLRVFFVVSPPVNYALALSSVGRRDYVLGSALGLLGPVAVIAIFVDSLA